MELQEESDAILASRLQQQEVRGFWNSFSPQSSSSSSFIENHLHHQHQQDQQQDQQQQQQRRSSVRSDAAALLMEDRDIHRQMLVENANLAVFDVRASPRFIALCVLYGIVEVLVSSIILAYQWRNECDIGLHFWLFIFILRYTIVFPQEYCRYIARSRRSIPLMRSVHQVDQFRSVFLYSWLTYACIMLWASKTCGSTASPLYNFVLSLAILHFLFTCYPLLMLVGFILCLPCLLIFLRFFQPAEGLSKTDLQQLEERVFGDREETAEQTCVICQNDYVTGEKLKVLSCEHEFHSACVEQWLALKATCPLCRRGIGRFNDNPSAMPLAPDSPRQQQDMV